MSIREAYEASLQSHGHDEDAAQLDVVARLDDLRQRLETHRPRGGLRRWFARGDATAGETVRGLYLCGAGAHPGGGVTGAPGYNAAHQLLRDHRRG